MMHAIVDTVHMERAEKNRIGRGECDDVVWCVGIFEGRWRYNDDCAIKLNALVLGVFTSDFPFKDVASHATLFGHELGGGGHQVIRRGGDDVLGVCRLLWTLRTDRGRIRRGRRGGGRAHGFVCLGGG